MHKMVNGKRVDLTIKESTSINEERKATLQNKIDNPPLSAKDHRLSELRVEILKMKEEGLI